MGALLLVLGTPLHLASGQLPPTPQPMPPTLSGGGAWAFLTKDQRESVNALPQMLALALALPRLSLSQL